MDRSRAGVLLAGAAAFVNLYAPHSLLPLLRPWMGTSAVLIGLVISAGTFGVALAAPIAGRVADRVGRRRFIIASAFAALVPTVLMCFVQTPAQLIAARFAEGLLLPGVFAVTVAFIGDEWRPEESRSVLALYVAGTIGGGFCGRLTAGLVGEVAGWRWAFAAIAVLQLGFALCIRNWLPAERRLHRAAVAPTSTLALLTNPVLLCTYAAGFATLFSLVGGFTYVTLHLSQPPFSLGPAWLSMIFTVYLVGMFTTTLGGRLLNRLGHLRLLVAAWGLSISGLALSLIPWLPAIILGLCLFSAGLFFVQTAATSFVGEAAPAGSRGTAVGFYVTAYYIGGTVGGVLPAPLWDRYGWPGVVALILLAGLGSSLLARTAVGRFRDTARPA